MTFEQLIIFLTAVETLNFSETARRLGQSQPAVSQQIKNLETELNVSLFERSYRLLTLTEAGATLYPYALRIRQEMEAARSAVSELQGEITGQLRIGGSTTNGNYLIPKMLVRLKQAYPQINIQMLIENGANLLEQLHRGSLDLLLLEGPRPQVDNRFKVSAFYTDELVVVKHPKFKIPQRLTARQIAHFPWILREHGSGTREILLQNFLESGVSVNQINVLIELGTIESVKQAVIHTDALGYLSRLAIEKELATGELQIVSVKNLNISRKLWLVRPADTYLTAAMKVFAQFLSVLEKS